jgi:hypothetical protein
MQFAGMAAPKYLQCGGAKCITYSCVCPNFNSVPSTATLSAIIVLPTSENESKTFMHGERFRYENGT